MRIIYNPKELLITKLINRYDIAGKTLEMLNRSLTKLQQSQFEDYEELRDAIFQRFKYSVDTFWKYLNEYLKSEKSIKIPAPRPKSVFRECSEIGLISKDEYLLCVGLIDDRNETSHGYNEDLAEEIASHIPKHYEVMHDILEKVIPKK